MECMMLMAITLLQIITCALVTKFLYQDLRDRDMLAQAANTGKKYSMWQMGSFHYVFMWIGQLFFIIATAIHAYVNMKMID